MKKHFVLAFVFVLAAFIATSNAQIEETRFVEDFETMEADEAPGDYVKTSKLGTWIFKNAYVTNKNFENNMFGTKSARLEGTGSSIEMDFDYTYGISRVKIYVSCPKGTAYHFGSPSFVLQMSDNYGGDWVTIVENWAMGNNFSDFTVPLGFQAPVRLRLVHLGEEDLFEGQEVSPINVDNIEIDIYTERAFDWYINAHLNTEKSVSYLNETFENSRASKPIGLEAWYNLITAGEYQFVAHQEKDPESGEVTNTCAKISAYDSENDSTGIHESYLITPPLNAVDNLPSKMFTFRVKGENLSEEDSNRLELFYLEAVSSGYNIGLMESVKMPSSSEDNGKWFEHQIDFSQIETPEAFFLGFRFFGNGGKNHPAVFYIDDVTYGRTDFPKISASSSRVQINTQAGLKGVSDTLWVEAANLEEDIRAVISGKHKEYFSLSSSNITKEGGWLVLDFFAEEVGAYEAELVLSSAKASDVKIELVGANREPEPSILINGLEKDLSLSLSIASNEASVESKAIEVEALMLNTDIKIEILQENDHANFELSKNVLAAGGKDSFTIKFNLGEGSKDNYYAKIRLSAEKAEDRYINVSVRKYASNESLFAKAIVHYWEGSDYCIKAPNLKEIELYSFSGKLERKFAASQDGVNRISMQNLPSGLYLIRLHNAEGFWQILKVVKP